MNLLLSFIYAPLIYLALRHFNIKEVSLTIFGLSLLWFIYTFIKHRRDIYFPILYLSIAILTFFLEDFLVLKVLPLLITFIITMIMFISYLKGESFIYNFVSRFSKKEFSQKEQAYIHRSTFYWVLLGFVNLGLHLYAFLGENINFWVFYSSIGGYLLLIGAGLIQFLHKKFIFSKEP